MGSCSTNSSLQTAPVCQMVGGESGSGTLTSNNGTSLDDLPSTTSQAVAFGGERGISPALALLIAQTVQAALAAKIDSLFSPSIDYTATFYLARGSYLIGSCLSGEFVSWGRSIIAGQLS